MQFLTMMLKMPVALSFDSLLSAPQTCHKTTHAEHFNSCSWSPHQKVTHNGFPWLPPCQNGRVNPIRESVSEDECGNEKSHNSWFLKAFEIEKLSS